MILNETLVDLGGGVGGGEKSVGGGEKSGGGGTLSHFVVVDRDGVGGDDSVAFFGDFLRVYCIWSVFVGFLFFLLIRCWRRAYIAQREKLSLEDAEKITFVVTAQEVIANGGGYEEWKQQRRGSMGERSVFTISEVGVA